MTRYNKRNDYGRDLEVQKNTMFCGIPFVVNLQDRAMTETMGPIIPCTCPPTRSVVACDAPL